MAARVPPLQGVKRRRFFYGRVNGGGVAGNPLFRTQHLTKQREAGNPHTEHLAEQREARSTQRRGGKKVEVSEFFPPLFVPLHHIRKKKKQ